MKFFTSVSTIIANYAIWLLILVYIYVQSMYWDCLPIWDGMVYYTGLIKAIHTPFDLLNYSIDGHICQGFMLLSGLPYEFYSGNYYVFNIWITLFGVLSTVGFYKLLAFFFKYKLGKIEMVLITALFAFHPSVLSSMTHFASDEGLITFFILYWLMLLNEKRVAATVFAFILLFTKETAMLLLPLPFLFCWLLKPSLKQRPVLKGLGKYFYRNSKTPADSIMPISVLFISFFRQSPERIQWVKKNLMVIVIPYLFLGLFVLYKVFIRHQPAMWVKINTEAATLDYFGPDKLFINYLGMIFIINFNWVLTLLWAVLLIIFITRRKSLTDLFQKKLLKLFTLLFLAALFVLTLVVSYSNVRYVMLLVPLMILAIAQLLFIIIPSGYVRMSVAMLLLLLFAFENVRTIDPVSKAFFGTLNFGDHKILNLTQRTHESPYCYERDQFVYNLEYLREGQLLNKIYIDIRPTSKTYFAFTPYNVWGSINPLDSNYRMAYKDSNQIKPQVVLVNYEQKLTNLPSELYLIDLPNYDNGYLIETMNKYYPFNVSKLYDIDGYQINVIHYKSNFPI